MTTAQRREEILALLNQADAPIAAKDLAARFGVSRQVIVGDVALLRASGVDIQIPRHYFPGDDPTKKPVMNWRSCAHLLYANWLNYCVYQTSPYDIRDIRLGVRTDD